MDQFICQLGRIEPTTIKGWFGLYSDRCLEEPYAYFINEAHARAAAKQLDALDHANGDPTHDYLALDETDQQQLEEFVQTGRLGRLLENGKPLGFAVANSIGTLLLLDVLNHRPIRPLVHHSKLTASDQILINEGLIDVVPDNFKLF